MKDRNTNRNSMPTIAAFVDEIRAQGVSVKVVYARENGCEVGKRPNYAEVFTIPPNYLRPATTRKGASNAAN